MNYARILFYVIGRGVQLSVVQAGRHTAAALENVKRHAAAAEQIVVLTPVQQVLCAMVII